MEHKEREGELVESGMRSPDQVRVRGKVQAGYCHILFDSKSPKKSQLLVQLIWGDSIRDTLVIEILFNTNSANINALSEDS